MNKNILNTLIKFAIFLFVFSCSEEEKQICKRCETFFAKNNHFDYPMRRVEKNNRGGIGIEVPNTNEDSITLEKDDMLTQQRLLTPKEYELLEDLMFCFIGKDREYVLYYFKDFWFDDLSSIYSKDSLSIRTYTYANISTEKIFSKGIYEVINGNQGKEINLWFNKIDDKYIFLGSESDSVRLQNCLENHGSN